MKVAASAASTSRIAVPSAHSSAYSDTSPRHDCSGGMLELRDIASTCAAVNSTGGC